MKKSVVISILLIVLLLGIAGCNNEGNSSNVSEKTATVFSEEDVAKASEMIVFLEEKVKEFQTEATNSIESGEIKRNNEGELREPLIEMSESIILTPFLEKYPNSIIGEKLGVSFESTSSEPCSLGNCKYDGIATPLLNYKENNYSIYTSKEFKVSQLIFT